MTPEELHVASFRNLVTRIQAAGIVPATTELKGATWRMRIAPRPLCTYTVTCDSATGRLVVSVRRLLRRTVVMDSRLAADSLDSTVARAAACIVGDLPAARAHER